MAFNHDNVIPFSTPAEIDLLPPQNIEAEESILGGIMIDPQAMDRINDTLIPEAFYVGAHAIIYQAAKQLHNTGQPTDLLYLSARLSDHKLLERIGGRNRLATIFDRTVSAINIDALAQLVMEKYYRRQLIKVGNEIVKLGYEMHTDLPQVFEQAEMKVFSVTQNSYSDCFCCSSCYFSTRQLHRCCVCGLFTANPSGVWWQYGS